MNMSLPSEVFFETHNGKYIGNHHEHTLKLTETKRWWRTEYHSGKYAFKSKSHQRYMCAANDGNLTANRQKRVDWELFSMVHQGGERYKVKCYDGKYIYLNGTKFRHNKGGGGDTFRVSNFDHDEKAQKEKQEQVNDLLSANIQEKDKEIKLLQQKNDAMDYQFKLNEAKIKSLSSTFNQKMQEMRSMNETQNNKIKLLNDRITTIFEEERKEKKENESEINKLKQEINKLKSNVNENKKGNNNENMNKLRLFFEYELNLPQYFDAIIDAGFTDILSLNDLTNEDLKEINVKIAHRKKILKAIQQKQPKKQPQKQPEGGTDWH